MQAHLLRTGAQLRTGTLLCTGSLRRRQRAGFYCAPMLLRGRAASRTAGGGTQIINHVQNSLRISNNIAMQVTLWGGAAQRSRTPLSVPALRTDFVNQTLDEVLRAQLTRELEVMERGENVATNQRRRRMLRRTLEQKPARTVQRFYGAQMRLLASGASGTAKPQEGFFGDIVRERTIKKIETVRTHTSAQTVVVHQDAPLTDAKMLNRLTEQVAQRLEQRARRGRDTTGIW